MDGLGWDHSQIVKNTSFLWSNQHEETEESLNLSNSNYCLSGAKMDLQEDLFNQIQAFQKAQASQLNPISERCQEAKRSAANAMMPASQELCSSPLTNKPSATAPSIADFGLSNQSKAQVSDGLPNGSKAGSFETLDCLLSATNSNTDTTVEDDGISMILSDCRDMWNFGVNSAVSSTRESGSNACIDARNKEMHDHASDIDGTVSKSSSNQDASQGKCSQAKFAFTKRSSDQNELKLGASYAYLDNLQTACSTMEGGFKLISENPPRPSKKLRWDKRPMSSSSNINFQQPNSSVSSSSIEELDPEAIAQMKEMIYRAAAFRPVNLSPEVIEKPKRKNVRISSDPQTVAARQRRGRISERIRLLQSLVPGGSKMDTASMLDEAANYLKFLRSQVKALENLGHDHQSSVSCPPTTTNIAFSSPSSSLPVNLPFPMETHFLVQNPHHIPHP